MSVDMSDEIAYKIELMVTRLQMRGLYKYIVNNTMMYHEDPQKYTLVKTRLYVLQKRIQRLKRERQAYLDSLDTLSTIID